MEREQQTARLKRARRTAGIAGVLIGLLAASKVLIGEKVGSSSLVADGIHSATDLIALGASWFGLWIAGRPPTKRFPFGFYRAETIAALFISVLIIAMGGGIYVEGVRRLGPTSTLENVPLAVATAAFSLIAVCFFFVWGRKVAVETGSQSLMASAEEMRVDVFSTLLVLVTLIAARFQVPLIEGVTTIIISLMVIWVGCRNAWNALLSLMDATIDPELEARACELLGEMPGVRKVVNLRARKAGPFFFLEGEIQVAPSMDIKHAHLLSHYAQERIRQERSEVESVLLHLEPFEGDTKRVLIPIDDSTGMGASVSSYFSRAPFFLVMALEKGLAGEIVVLDNSLSQNDIDSGFVFFHELIEGQRIDVILAQQIGETPFHILQDHGLETYQIPAGITAEDALSLYLKREVPLLHGPVHPSRGSDS